MERSGPWIVRKRWLRPAAAAGIPGLARRKIHSACRFVTRNLIHSEKRAHITPLQVNEDARMLLQRHRLRLKSFIRSSSCFAIEVAAAVGLRSCYHRMVRWRRCSGIVLQYVVISTLRCRGIKSRHCPDATLDSVALRASRKSKMYKIYMLSGSYRCNPVKGPSDGATTLSMHRRVKSIT